MRITLITAALLASLAPGIAEAQSYWCDRPSEPYMPYEATAEDLELAGDEVEAYVQTMEEYLDCLNMEADDAASEAQRVIQEWNLLVSQRQ